MHVHLALALSFCAPAPGPVVPKDTLQLVVGIAPEWSATTAVLYRFERKRGGKWKRVGKAWDANIGKYGLAAGRGLLEWCGPDDERKVEHDRKAPAGAFYLGDIYGFADGYKKAWRGKMKLTKDSTVCVSDPGSKWYNQIVDTEKTERDWDWARSLRRKDRIKSRAIMIGVNGGADPQRDPPVPYEGSCVLFHLSRGRPTVGCTSLPKEPLDALIDWLKPKSKPVYLLMTREQYDELAAVKDSGLPALP